MDPGRHKWLRILPVILMILICSGSFPADGQILSDTSAVRIIREGIKNIYNLKFEDALKVYNTIYRLYPEHPVVSLYKGIVTYWENYPLIPSSPASTSYEEDLRTCIRLCEKNNHHSDHAEILLADLCARGMLLLFYADNGMTSEVIPLARNTYHSLRESFSYTSVYPDFYYFTGIYNYYRDTYPRIHPVYKSVAFLFPPGDSAVGLKQLLKCGEEAIVLEAEAYFILSWIYVNYENSYRSGLLYSKRLNEMYPDNLLYRATFLKNLLLLNEYDEAENIIGAYSGGNGNAYYRSQLNIFNGIIQEKKYKNNVLAGEFYNKGIAGLANFGTYGKEYSAYGYFGLSRICDKNGDKQGKRLYHRKAMQLADFKKNTFDN
jgi:hypothetical protein